MVFTAEIANKLKYDLFRPEMQQLIKEATNSKFAIMSPEKVVLIGEFNQSGGAFFSNYSYLNYTSYAGNCCSYPYSDYYWPSEFKISVFTKTPNEDTAAKVLAELEKSYIFVDEYNIGKKCIEFKTDNIPVGHKDILGMDWMGVSADRTIVYYNGKTMPITVTK